ncbi:MAG: glycosyltransferase family 2 protein [Anaerolineae bacterium]|nr:glycosyltransferase family 2 protein [Anaerolineae bacterium]
MTDLSIIIVSYNTREPLRRTLESIRREGEGLRIQTIVVDNASRDDSAAMIRDAFPEVTLIEPGRNTWFTGGNNLGFTQAQGEYTLILNPDTVIQPGTLQTLLAYLRAHPEVGAVTCQMRGLDHSLQRTCSQVPQFVDLLLGYTFLGAALPFWRAQRRTQMWYEGWDRASTRAVEVIPDSCMMSPTPLLARLKLFDETLRLYFTEDDICRRILNAGYAVHFVAEAVILHEEHASTRLVQRLASQVYFDDLILFTRKWYGGLAALALRGLIAPTRVLMDAAQRLRGERKSIG